MKYLFLFKMTKTLLLSRKPESPKPKTKDGTPKQCNCKHSKCLKLYCECFTSGTYCENCNCVDCHNNMKPQGGKLSRLP
ncbi:hypothetical protein QQ045_013138 [Rhodiola kirilowii]